MDIQNFWSVRNIKFRNMYRKLYPKEENTGNTSRYYGWWASQAGLVVKNLPANSGDKRDMSLITGRKDPLEKEMAAHSSPLAWRIPWTEEPGGLPSMGSESQTQPSNWAHTHIMGNTEVFSHADLSAKWEDSIIQNHLYITNTSSYFALKTYFLDYYSQNLYKACYSNILAFILFARMSHP